MMKFWSDRARAKALPAAKRAEVDHWNEVEQKVSEGMRLFWLNHPRVADHYYRKARIEGLDWRVWIQKQVGGPAGRALELGCGSGKEIARMVSENIVTHGLGIDLDSTRFSEARASANSALALVASDIENIELQAESYDLIFALQSFHHFERIEHIMQQVHNALKPGGYFVLDEFVGPARFQWTDLQLEVTAHLLAFLPRHLRLYQNGIEKAREGRSTVEEVMRVCDSEAVRSNEIVGAFYEHFNVRYHRNLGGTIQHLLYSGIIQNFPDDDVHVNSMIDAIDAIESLLIEQNVLASDFVLLIGGRRI